jgi:hypothetical protein
MQIDVEKLYLSCTLFPAVGKTNGWTEINGATNTGNSTRTLGYCDDFQFEYAIDGKVTTLNFGKWLERLHKIQRVVETVTLLNDPSFTGGEEKQV